MHCCMHELLTVRMSEEKTEALSHQCTAPLTKAPLTQLGRHTQMHVHVNSSRLTVRVSKNSFSSSGTVSRVGGMICAEGSGGAAGVSVCCRRGHACSRHWQAGRCGAGLACQAHPVLPPAPSRVPPPPPSRPPHPSPLPPPPHTHTTTTTTATTTATTHPPTLPHLVVCRQQVADCHARWQPLGARRHPRQLSAVALGAQREARVRHCRHWQGGGRGRRRCWGSCSGSDGWGPCSPRCPRQGATR